MDGEAPAAAALRLAAVARKWLENPRDSLARSREEGCGDAFNTVVMPGFRVSLAEPGRLVCSFRVPATVTDADGRWHAGAMAAAVDNLCSAVVYTADGVHRFTVNQAMSFFSPAAHGVRGGGDGWAGGAPEGEADGRCGGGAEEGVRRAGGDREAVDDLYPGEAGEEWREQEQEQEQTLK